MGKGNRTLFYLIIKIPHVLYKYFRNLLHRIIKETWFTNVSFAWMIKKYYFCRRFTRRHEMACGRDATAELPTNLISQRLQPIPNQRPNRVVLYTRTSNKKEFSPLENWHVHRECRIRSFSLDPSMKSTSRCQFHQRFYVRIFRTNFSYERCFGSIF